LALGGGFASKKPTAKSDLANRTMTDLIGITIHAWQRVPGAWPIAVGRSGGRAIGNIGNPFAIAKIANAVS
jgi:hypothetical protein